VFRRRGGRRRGRHRAAPPLAPRLQRAGVVLVASFTAMLGVSAAGVAAPPAAVVDQRFLTDVRTRGHIVTPGTDEEVLISAARKLCLLTDSRTYVQRRATLTGQEVDGIRRAFGGDSQAFIKIAIGVYCS
jgi:hypothetical protein